MLFELLASAALALGGSPEPDEMLARDLLIDHQPFVEEQDNGPIGNRFVDDVVVNEAAKRREGIFVLLQQRRKQLTSLSLSGKATDRT